MVLKAQARVTDHKADGRISIQTLRGHIRMRARGRTFDPPAGSLLSLDRGLTHDVEALEDSALLLTVAWRGRDGSWKRNGKTPGFVVKASQAPA